MTSILITYIGIHTFIHSVPPLKSTRPVYREQLWWSIFYFSCLTLQALLCSSSPTFHYPLRHLLYLLARYSSHVWVWSHKQLTHSATLPSPACTHLIPGCPATFIIQAFIPRELQTQHYPVQLAENLTN